MSRLITRLLVDIQNRGQLAAGIYILRVDYGNGTSLVRKLVASGSAAQ